MRINIVTIQQIDMVPTYLVITIEDSEYGIPVSYVRSIDRKPLIIPSPTRTWYTGIAEIRGENLPVFDLTAKLNTRKETLLCQDCIIVLKINHFKFSIVANSSKELIKIDNQPIQLLPAYSQETKLIQVIAKLPNRNILLLNPEGLFKVNVRNNSSPFRKETKVS